MIRPDRSAGCLRSQRCNPEFVRTPPISNRFTVTQQTSPGTLPIRAVRDQLAQEGVVVRRDDAEPTAIPPSHLTPAGTNRHETVAARGMKSFGTDLRR